MAEGKTVWEDQMVLTDKPGSGVNTLKTFTTKCTRKNGSHGTLETETVSSPFNWATMLYLVCHIFWFTLSIITLTVKIISRCQGKRGGIRSWDGKDQFTPSRISRASIPTESQDTASKHLVKNITANASI